MTFREMPLKSRRFLVLFQQYRQGQVNRRLLFYVLRVFAFRFDSKKTTHASEHMALQFSLLTLSQHLEAFRESFRKAPRQNTFSLADAGIQFSSIRCLDVHEQRTKFSRPARVCGKIKEKK